MIRYDNLTPAVIRVALGRERLQNPRFVVMRFHYGFDLFFCIPGIEGAHEKGGVEGEIGRFRRRHLTPVPHVGSLAALNAARLPPTDVITPDGSAHGLRPSAPRQPVKRCCYARCPRSPSTSPPPCRAGSMPRPGSVCASPTTRSRPAAPADASRSACAPTRSGSSNRAGTGTQLLVDLGVAWSHSRPHVSNDNPYSESAFKTLKYAPIFPENFGSLADARGFGESFFGYYNHEHRHSRIGLHTPASVHYGTAEQVQSLRQRTLDSAYAAHPKRFGDRRPTPPKIPTAAWINQPSQEEALIQTA